MSEPPADIFDSYLRYVKNTEPPAFFHRWSMITSVGALLERNFFFEHGHFSIYPNVYCMLIGAPGTRKSTAIKLAVKTLKLTGYSTFAAEKTSKEKFILDLAEGPESDKDELDKVLFGENSSSVTPCFIAADEFNDFFGNNNLEFISLLGSLWDYNGPYESRLKNSKSVIVNNPTISILGGNTPTAFSLAFPVEVLGQGFFSRILLIYADPSGKRFTFPEIPAPEETAHIKELLQRVKYTAVGSAKLTQKAKYLLDKIYKSDSEMHDVRFASYSTRRFTHLLKLSLIHAAAGYGNIIDEAAVVKANTVLHFTERFMPKALGEFGKAKNSDITHKIVSIIESNYRVTSFKEIWSQVYNDLEKMQDLGTLLQNLVAAGRIQQIAKPTLGYLPVKSMLREADSDTVNWEYLSEEERGMER
jgi:hypothetical protein